MLWDLLSKTTITTIEVNQTSTRIMLQTQTGYMKKKA